MSNGGAVSGAVGNGEKLATVRAFAQDVFDGLQEEPLWKADLSGAARAFAAKGCDDDFLGCRCEGGEREGFEFGGGLGAAKEGFNAADFVEVGHASAGVSKGIHHGGHGEHGGIRNCAAVQVCLGFARSFLNMLKKEGCFFNVVLSEICIRFSDKTKTRQIAHRGEAWRVLLVLGRSQRGIL